MLENLSGADIARLAQAYTDPAIAAKQRGWYVNTQLAAMYAGNAPRHFSVLGELLQGLKAQSDLESVTLLDAGCASCYYHEIVDFYVPGWIEYTGVDYNSGMVEMTHKLYPGLPIYQADMHDLNLFPDKSFDVVMEGATLTQIRDWKPALSELARVAKHWLILHRELLYWNDEPTSYEVVEAYDNQVWSVRFNKLELVNFLAAQGFSLVSTACVDSSGMPQLGQIMLFERLPMTEL